MKTQDSQAKVVWVANDNGEVNFLEVSVEGGLPAAVEKGRDLSSTEGFVLGQVLAPDGRVMATLAPGAIKLNS